MQDRIVEKQIDALVGALTDPIVVYDPGWPIPERLKGEIQLARLAQLLTKEEWVATDVEALAYLSNASMVAPMATEWANIYMHLFTRWMGNKTPEDLRRDEVSSWEQEKPKELKAWLWNTRVRARQERARAKRAQEKAEAAARAPKQLGLPV